MSWLASVSYSYNCQNISRSVASRPQPGRQLWCRRGWLQAVWCVRCVPSGQPLCSCTDTSRVTGDCVAFHDQISTPYSPQTTTRKTPISGSMEWQISYINYLDTSLIKHTEAVSQLRISRQTIKATKYLIFCKQFKDQTSVIGLPLKKMHTHVSWLRTYKNGTPHQVESKVDCCVHGSGGQWPCGIW